MWRLKIKHSTSKSKKYHNFTDLIKKTLEKRKYLPNINMWDHIFTNSIFSNDLFILMSHENSNNFLSQCYKP